MFNTFPLIDIGSTEEYWQRQDAAQVVAEVEFVFSTLLFQALIDLVTIILVYYAGYLKSHFLFTKFFFVLASS